MDDSARKTLTSNAFNPGGAQMGVPAATVQPQTSFTASVGCAVKQIPHRFDACTGRNCGRFQTAVSRLRGDAEIGLELSLPPARGVVGKLAALRRWMKRAQKTGIHALTRFVRTLQQDLRAVEAAVTEPWSNGPVEGHINRLKTLKRQMYGRAGVKLLRARLLPESRIAGQCVHQT
jgi:hypothetical protein